MFTGRFVELEPLEQHHLPLIVAALGFDRSSYSLALVPKDADDAATTVTLRLAAKANGTWEPFVQRRLSDGAVVGMTNFIILDRWDRSTKTPTSIEIGGTWLSPSAQRTPINTEAKFLLMQHAFEVYGVARLQIKTDERNARSRAAIERLGATFEGILRNFQPGQGELGEGSPRNTAMYSVIPEQWPPIKANLQARLDRLG